MDVFPVQFPFAAGAAGAEVHQHADGTESRTEHTPWVYVDPDSKWDSAQGRSTPPPCAGVAVDTSLPDWEQQAVPLLARDGYVVLRSCRKDAAATPTAPHPAELLIEWYAESDRSGSAAHTNLASECAPSHSFLAHPTIMSLCNGVLGRQVLRKDLAGLADAMAPPSLFTDYRVSFWDLHTLTRPLISYCSRTVCQ